MPHLLYHTPLPSDTPITGLYPYTSDLLALAACTNPLPPPLPPALCNITTPLNWRACLAPHSDQAYAQYLLDGIANGFRIGVTYTAVKFSSANTYHPSANEHPDVISKPRGHQRLTDWPLKPAIPPLCPYQQPRCSPKKALCR